MAELAFLSALAKHWVMAVAVFALTTLFTRWVLAYLRQRQILDMPNERSSHTLATPRGGGLATTPVMVVFLGFLAWQQHSAMLAVLAAGALALLGISWLDDRHNLPPLPRLVSQIVVIAAGLSLLPAQTTILSPLLPVWLDRVLAGVAWLWFVNLYNFMDGIDGITGVETVCLGFGIALVVTVEASVALFGPALCVATIGVAFLLWNWHPAKLFLGDSGSVPLGFVLGGLLLLLAAQGQLAAALILPAYYVADATITLACRAIAGEKIWLAHRKHFYQRAVQGGKRHDQVALLILTGNLALMGAALLAASGQPWLGLGAALSITVIVLTILHIWGRRKRV